jgi:RHS repeat-associated protein
VVSYADFLPFGAQMTGRTGTSTAYRYGFQGQEKDEAGEFGTMAHYSYSFRIYSQVLGKFLSVDPLTSSYPHNSPYAFSENRVINSIELEGLEAVDLVSGKQIKMGTQTELKVLKSSDYSLWKDMLQWEKSSKFRSIFDQADKGRILDQQEMDWAYSDEMNTDYYAVEITKLPTGMT